ncbi:carcinoembryonic antigen-related cell adhesion molecule 1-like [Pelobates cultripes]|uniref:Carcinoembryonic antigen-related cell adhesion molecule 1-like n=1 Tax=Pelobates cultripes TaxID=61616 RepID=A0AAD1WRD3_PELCU|nr:carcinoembryonic antigen-related cell adhesion molecule 1-like [Pelobates cultripes]
MFCNGEKIRRMYALTVLLSVWMQLTIAISIQPIPQYPVVGQSVTLSVTGINGDIWQFFWYKGLIINTDNHILTYTPDLYPPQSRGRQYSSRTSGLPDASLKITDLLFADQGIYTVYIQADGGPRKASLNLTVYNNGFFIPQGLNSCPAFSPQSIAGIIGGTVCGFVLIISVTVLLYKRCILLDRESKQGCSTCRKDPSPLYNNVLDIGKDSVSNEGPVYMDLQFKYPQDTYSELKG